MALNAVTDAASAAANQDESTTGFLPEDEHYRLTGEFKPEKADASAAASEEVKDAAATPGDKGDDTAAASEAATTEEDKGKGPAQSKTAQTSESRWAKITRENREMRERLARLETKPVAEVSRETQQASQSAAEGTASTKPKIDDIDPKTGKAKYPSYDAYQDARDEWNRKEAVREFQETSAKTAQESQTQQLAQSIQQRAAARAEAARKIYSDYDDTIQAIVSEKDQFGHDAVYFPQLGHIDRFLHKSERGAEILYHVAKNISDPNVRAIFARDASGLNYLMDGVEQLYALAEIERSLPAKAAPKAAPSPVRPITQASRPPNQVSGNGTVAKDAVEQAVEDQDQETYAREANARDLARLKRK